MPKVSPYDDRFTEQSQDKIMKHGLTIAEKYMSGNDKVAPQQVIEWLADLNTDGWTNVRVQCYTEPCDENNLESQHLVVRGDRIETDKEFKKRQEDIIMDWQSKYERFLLEKNYYENTDLGQAQVAAIKEKSKRRIRYPEGMKKDGPE